MTDCPLCAGWTGELDTNVRQFELCGNHMEFMRALDVIIEENREVLGRLAEFDRLQFGRSLEQMRRRLAVPRRHPDKIRGVYYPDEGDGLAWLRGESGD